ncbi:Holliday junction branch migration protein RuvA [Halpernia sp. GG3]
MIYSLRGKVLEMALTSCVIECNGVGYTVGISLQTSDKIKMDENIFIYIQQIIREDANLLFGFNTLLEKEMFNLLISVNGVGAVSTLIMLSTFSLQEIASAIQSGNSGLIQKAKGIGIKTAERIIVDLRDKVQKFRLSDENISNFSDNKIKEESLSALEVLGIPKKMSEKIADRILQENATVTTEELVKQILKHI